MTEQQAEPVACRFCHSKKGSWTWQCYKCGEIDDVQKPAAQPEQEPVAWMSSDRAWMWSDYSKAIAAVANIPTLTLIPLYVAPPMPVQEDAFEGWVKIDEVREHFDAVNCGTIYKHAGEGRVPLYTAPPRQQSEPVAWDKPSASFNEWWDSYRHDGGNPFQTDSFAYWAFEGWQAARLKEKNT